jgi:capsule polysaccharide export protein KpsE/RkpR
MRRDDSTRNPTKLEEEIILVSGHEIDREGQGSPGQGLPRARFLWSNRKTIGRAALIGLVVGLILAFVIPTRYQSITRLMPPDSSSSSAASMLAAISTKVPGLSAYAGNLMGLQNAGAVFVEVLQSRTLQDRLVNEFDLRKVYGKRLREDARKKLTSRTRIFLDRKSGVITIYVEDRDPKRAAAIGHAYTEELNSLMAELNTSAAHKERVFLEGRLDRVKKELESSEKEFSEFASKNTAIDIKEQGKALVSAAANLQGELIAAQSQLEGLRQIYTDNNVRVRQLQARIAEIQRSLNQLGGQSDATGANEASRNGPRSNTELKGSPYPSLKQLPVLGVTYADLYRQTRVQEVVFETLTQAYEMAKVEEAKETPSVKVLDEPEVPERKSFPPRRWVIALSTLFAVLGAMGWIFGSDMWAKLDPENPKKALITDVVRDITRDSKKLFRKRSTAI